MVFICNYAQCLHWHLGLAIRALESLGRELNGKGTLYSLNYSDKDLESWAKKMQEWSKTKDVYAYFNNDVLGYAVANVQTLKKMI